MKRKLSLFLLALTLLASSCSIFKRGCGCPKVAYGKAQGAADPKKS